MIRKYDVILFDLDGTLTDPQVGIINSIQHSLKYFGIIEEDMGRLKKFIGPPLKEAFMEYYCFDNDKAVLAIEKYREYFAVKGLGDRKHDIIGAKETGIDSVGVLYGYGSRHELENEHPTFIAEDVNELRKVLLRVVG